MRLLIGSRALKYHSDLYIVTNSLRTWDWDWISDYDSYNLFVNNLNKKRTKILGTNKISVYHEKNIHEFELAFQDSYLVDLLNIAKNDTTVATKHISEDYLVASPGLVFALKSSHRFLKDSPHFLKTMLDYNHLKSIGVKIPNSLIDWYKRREKETYNYKHPKLKDVMKADFFKDDMVPYKYDHDTIHSAVKNLEYPAYNYFKPNTAEIDCSKEMFDACPESTKLYSVLEESYVLALERSQIPNNFNVDPKISFDIALSKVCSSITSGWWRDYAYDNYFKVQDMYSNNYIDKFKSGVVKGIVKELVK